MGCAQPGRAKIWGKSFAVDPPGREDGLGPVLDGPLRPGLQPARL